MKETLKVGSRLTLEKGARYFTDRHNMMSRNEFIYASVFTEAAQQRDGAVPVKITGFSFRPDFAIRIASVKDPSQEGWIRLAGVKMPKVIAVEVERS